jgi:hypothetical protein
LYQFLFSLVIHFYQLRKKYKPSFTDNERINTALELLTRFVRSWFYVEFYINTVSLLALSIIVLLLAMEFLETCGQSASILLRADAIGEADAGKPISGTIVGSAHTMLLLESIDRNNFQAIPMESIREIAVSKPSTRSNLAALGCMLVQ